MGFFNSVSKVGAVVSAFSTLLPLFTSAIEAAEAALGPSTGSAKLSMVVGVLKAAYSVEQTAAATWDSIEPAVVNAINAIVASYKLVKGSPAPTPAPAA